MINPIEAELLAEARTRITQLTAEIERLKPSVKIALEFQQQIDDVIGVAAELGCAVGSFDNRLQWIRARALEGTEIQRMDESVSWKSKAQRAEAEIERLRDVERNFNCFRCRDPYTPLYCLNCAKGLLAKETP